MGRFLRDRGRQSLLTNQGRIDGDGRGNALSQHLLWTSVSCLAFVQVTFLPLRRRLTKQVQKMSFAIKQSFISIKDLHKTYHQYAAENGFTAYIYQSKRDRGTCIMKCSNGRATETACDFHAYCRCDKEGDFRLIKLVTDYVCQSTGLQEGGSHNRVAVVLDQESLVP